MPAPGRYAAHPIVKYVRSLPGHFYLQREAAESLRISRTTLLELPARYPQVAQLGPSHTAGYGAITLQLYTPERVERIRAFLAQRDARMFPLCGRNSQIPMWTPAELAARRRGYDRARKRIARAATTRQRGDEKTAAALEASGRVELAALADARAKQLAKMTAKRVRAGAIRPPGGTDTLSGDET